VSLARVAFFLLAAFALLTSQISAAYAVACLLLLVWAAGLVRERRVPQSLRSPFVFLFAVLAALTILSAVFSRDPSVSARHLPGLALFLLVPVAMDLCDEPRRARAIFAALALSGLAQALLGLREYARGGDDLENRIRGTLSHYMTFSGLTMIAACLLLGFLLEERGRKRWIGLLCLIPFAAVLFTYTRGAYVGVLAAALVYVLARRPRSLLVLAPAVLAVFILAPPEIRDRIRSITDLSDRTNRDRIAMARAGARIVAGDPVFGLGPEMVAPFYPLYRDTDAPRWRVPHLHNNTLQIAASSGVFAAGAYLAILGLFFARAVALLRREPRPDRAALWAGALLAGTALSAAGLFEYNFGDTEVEMATLLVFAVPFSKASESPGD
jgi:O-antigen ligase